MKNININKKTIVVLITTIFSLSLIISSCTKNARPFELLSGITPLGDVDFTDMNELNTSIVSNINELDLSFDYNNVDMTFYEGKFILVSDETVTAISNESGGSQSYSTDELDGIQDLKGVGTTPSGTIVAAQNDENDDNSSTIVITVSNTNGGVGVNGLFIGIAEDDRYRDRDSFYGFRTKYLTFESDKEVWICRQHIPIETENSYPDSDRPSIYEFIRKYELRTSDNQNPLIKQTFHSPKGQCYGITWFKDHLILVYPKFYEEDGRINYESSDKRLYVLDPKGMEWVGISSQAFDQVLAIASDDSGVWVLGSTSGNNEVQLNKVSGLLP